ncbi:MAG: DUF1684 domain-containing protein [Natronomonas sp.]
MDEAAYREELRSHRRQKDEAFGGERGSPLPPDQRADFDGLEYFEPSLAYRVEATIELTTDEETVTMETTAEGEQLYRRIARLRFEVPNAAGETVEESLLAYRRVDHDGDSLFVPFRDKTTGQQTYPAGRYMELHADGPLEDGATVTVDFNLAYNPFCAYSDAYECPLPPRENWLDVAIPAGERY